MIRQGSNPSKKSRRENSEDIGLRDKILKVSVNGEEMEEIQSKADKAGLSRSRFVREVALGYRLRERDTTLTPELIKMNAQLGRIGGNLNQVARIGHKGGVSAEWLEQAKKLMEEISRTIDGISDNILDW